MSFWDDIFTWNGKAKKVNHTHVVEVQDKNAYWLLNEELKRMHVLLKDPDFRNKDGSNAQAFWKKIEGLQKKLHELVDKAPDSDTQKKIVDMQQHMVEETLLGKEQK